MPLTCHCDAIGESLCPVHRKDVKKKPKTTYQRMTVASDLAGAIVRRTKDPVVKDMAWAISIVLSAPSEYLSKTYEKIDKLLEK